MKHPTRLSCRVGEKTYEKSVGCKTAEGQGHGFYVPTRALRHITV
jgi:hypothetical protein